jgi:hypothetical protein
MLFSFSRRDVLGFVVIALMGLQARAQVQISVGPNINITKSLANNAEETIAINPTAPNNLFASDTTTLASRYSLNGGLTWSNGNISALGISDGDVSAAFDSFGNLFLAQFSDSTTLQVVVGLSTNGGASFSLLYETSSQTNDQPTVTTGPGPNGHGSVWISYADSLGNQIAQGATVNGPGNVGAFGSAQAAPGPGGSFGDIVVGPNAEMMVCYQDPASGAGPDSIRVNLDPDGVGASSFNSAIVATGTDVGGFTPLPAQPNRTVDAESGLAWDRSPGPFHGRLYLMYTDRTNTSTADTDIFVRHSDDSGSTWSSRVRVNDDTVGNGKSQFLPRIALDQTTGFIAVSWYDCRNSPGNNTAELWAAVSIDGGVSFLPNVKVSSGISNGDANQVSNFNFGDYSGLAFEGGAFYPCWADNSNSTGDNPAGANNVFDMYTARVTVQVAALVLLNPRRTSSQFTASVNTLPGYTYYLESRTDLNSGIWTPAPGVPGDGTPKNLIDPSPSDPHRFYRVRRQ